MECKVWTGAVSSNGYGYRRDGKKVISAHRYAYITEVAPIPEGLEIDHLCNNPLCVEVAHLEVVSRQENLRRRDERLWSKREGKCKHGHSPDNIFINTRGRRACRECVRVANKKFMEANK